MVDACVRAAKERRKFRIIVIIPAIPGFAGDLRDNQAAGTRAIMDYQYKSICRGEESIMRQIESAVEGVNAKGKHRAARSGSPSLDRASSGILLDN